MSGAESRSQMPVISVIIPMFEAGAFIGRCLDSLKAEALDAWEAVVVDDGSTDDGPAIVRAAAELDPRIRLVVQRNAGLPAARNMGIAHSRGAWLRFLDADDWVTPGGLRALLDLSAAESALLVCGGVSYHDLQGEPLDWSFRPGVARVSLSMLVESHRFQASAAMVHRAALADHRFRDWAQGSEDLDLWLRLCEGGRSWRATDIDVAAYRLRPLGMSRDHAMMGRVAGRVVGECFDRTPALETAEPGKRERCLRRIAMERATALAWGSGACGGSGVELWRLLRPAPSVPVTPAEAAGAALWSLPYADCLPPTAWRDDRCAASFAECLAGFWSALERTGDAPPGLAQDGIRHLAALLVETPEVADEAARRLSLDGARSVVVHGLGRNAAAAVPALASCGLRVLGCDDAICPGEEVMIAGVAVPVVGPGEWPAGAAHLISPTNPGTLAGRLAGQRCVIHWHELAEAVAGAQRQRLIRLWPKLNRGLANAEAAA